MVEINLSTCIEVDHEVDMHYHVGNEVMVVLTTWYTCVYVS